jgi:hypothetical protein
MTEYLNKIAETPVCRVMDVNSAALTFLKLISYEYH